MNLGLLLSACERVFTCVCVREGERQKDLRFSVQTGLVFTTVVTLLVYCVHIFG